MNSRVYPTYKTKYRVANWASYDRALVGRGDLTSWVSPGDIIAHPLTEATVDDATMAIELIKAVDGRVASITGDAAYDAIAFCDAAGARGATVVVPPAKTARVSRRQPRSSARDRTIRKVQAVGRRQWKKASGYHRQARAENAFFRYKSIIGDDIRQRSRRVGD